MTLAADMVVLSEMADEISLGGSLALPGALWGLLSTKRGKKVGSVLGVVSRERLRFKHELDGEKSRSAQLEDSLRTEIQRLTDEILRLEGKR